RDRAACHAPPSPERVPRARRQWAPSAQPRIRPTTPWLRRARASGAAGTAWREASNSGPHGGQGRRAAVLLAAAQLAPFLLVVLAVEDVPFPAARHDPLGHASACELVEAAVEREGVHQGTLDLVQKQPVAAHPAELLLDHAALESVREEG